MGSLCQLYILNYPVYENKYFIDPIIMTMFRETDKRAYRRKISDRNPIVWGQPDDEDTKKKETAFEYRSSAINVIQRLEVMGFTFKKAEVEFKSGMSFILRKRNLDKIERENLHGYSFNVWMQTLKEIMDRGIKKVTIDELEKFPHIGYVLSRGFFDEDYFGFPCSDIRYVFRCMLELGSKKNEVVLDYTDLVHGGYYSKNNRLCDIAFAELADNYITNEKIIILTEGSTDKAILENTLSFLYPHVSDYYSFLDFHTPNLEGGASRLVHNVKAFIGSGIRNRIIAVFDNDTAATEALRGLSKVSLPPNIRIMQLPALDIAKNYPTIGPQGKTNVAINGLACSIELYLGRDMLKDENGHLIPVQWKGYNQTLKQYQGEILNKEKLQQKYLEFIKHVRTNPKFAKNHDWNPMKLIFEMIFGLFNQ